MSLIEESAYTLRLMAYTLSLGVLLLNYLPLHMGMPLVLILSLILSRRPHFMVPTLLLILSLFLALEPLVACAILPFFPLLVILALRDKASALMYLTILGVARSRHLCFLTPILFVISPIVIDSRSILLFSLLVSLTLTSLSSLALAESIPFLHTSPIPDITELSTVLIQKGTLDIFFAMMVLVMLKLTRAVLMNPYFSIDTLLWISSSFIPRYVLLKLKRSILEDQIGSVTSSLLSFISLMLFDSMIKGSMLSFEVNGYLPMLLLAITFSFTLSEFKLLYLHMKTMPRTSTKP
ncbi:MAG: hypothetical protein DRN15_00800 [Thermoprotei archaeon]|nr:MAG: hypothetical protein DRM97_04030 [Thermoprotei archaeon]RLF25224.1 MAG: hypothetical protein DRN15_00800 [Thermoprotei archaeon]